MSRSSSLESRHGRGTPLEAIWVDRKSIGLVAALYSRHVFFVQRRLDASELGTVLRMTREPVDRVDLRDDVHRIDRVVAMRRDHVRADEELWMPVFELEHGLKVARVDQRPRHADVAKRQQSLGTISGAHGHPLGLEFLRYVYDFSGIATLGCIQRRVVEIHGSHGPLSRRRWLIGRPVRAALVSLLRRFLPHQEEELAPRRTMPEPSLQGDGNEPHPSLHHRYCTDEQTSKRALDASVVVGQRRRPW